MSELRSNVTFRRLWLASTASSLGRVLLFLAAPYYVYEATGSALATGGAIVVETVPSLVLAPLAGVLVDRWDRRRLMIASDVGNVIVLLVFAFAGGGRLWALYLLLFAIGMIGQFSRPARDALIPQVVARSALLPANSVIILAEDVTRMVGPLLGGAIIATSSLSVIVLINAAMFLLSAVILWRAEGASRHAPAAGVQPEGHRLLSDLRAGWRVVFAAGDLRLILMLCVVVAIAGGSFQALLVPLVRGELGGSAVDFGMFVSAHSAGAIAGGLVFGMLPRIPSPRLVLSAALTALALTVFAIALAQSIVVVILLFGIVGIPLVGGSIVLRTVLQLAAHDRIRGRVLSVVHAVTAAATMAGVGAAGAVADLMGVRVALAGAGAVVLIAVVVATRLPSLQQEAEPQPVVA